MFPEIVCAHESMRVTSTQSSFLFHALLCFGVFFLISLFVIGNGLNESNAFTWMKHDIHSFTPVHPASVLASYSHSHPGDFVRQTRHPLLFQCCNHCSVRGTVLWARNTQKNKLGPAWRSDEVVNHSWQGQNAWMRSQRSALCRICHNTPPLTHLTRPAPHAVTLYLKPKVACQLPAFATGWLYSGSWTISVRGQGRSGAPISEGASDHLCPKRMSRTHNTSSV